MTKLSDGRVFECPECGCNNIEEVTGNIRQYRDVLLCEQVDYTWCATTYGPPRFESSYGDVERLQCSNCGEHIVEDTLEKHFGVMAEKGLEPSRPKAADKEVTDLENY